MSTTHEGPRGCGGQTHVRDDRHPLAYRIPPAIRITAWMVASPAKRAIVSLAARGLLPARVAEALIRWGGLTHA